jgi:hypothetical protein
MQKKIDESSSIPGSAKIQVSMRLLGSTSLAISVDPTAKVRYVATYSPSPRQRAVLDRLAFKAVPLLSAQGTS